MPAASAIGLGARRLGSGDHAASAANIFDHDRLAQCFLHWILNYTRGRVVDAARRERNDHGHWTIWIGLRRSGTR